MSLTESCLNELKLNNNEPMFTFEQQKFSELQKAIFVISLIAGIFCVFCIIYNIITKGGIYNTVSYSILTLCMLYILIAMNLT